MVYKETWYLSRVSYLHQLKLKVTSKFFVIWEVFSLIEEDQFDSIQIGEYSLQSQI